MRPNRLSAVARILPPKGAGLVLPFGRQRDREPISGQESGRVRTKTIVPIAGNRGFESGFLRRGVCCEPEFFPSGPRLSQERPAFCTRAHRLVVDRTPPSHMTPVHPSGFRDATATDAKGRNALHRAGDHPAGCRLATLVANLGIHRPAPHYSHSDYAAGARRHRPLCAADRNPGSGWAGVAARSRLGRRCSSGCAHWRGDLLQPLAPSKSAIAPRPTGSVPRQVVLCHILSGKPPMKNLLVLAIRHTGQNRTPLCSRRPQRCDRTT